MTADRRWEPTPEMIERALSQAFPSLSASFGPADYERMKRALIAAVGESIEKLKQELEQAKKAATWATWD